MDATSLLNLHTSWAWVVIIGNALAGIWAVAEEHKVSLRTATFIVACKRILHARELRGLYP